MILFSKKNNMKLQLLENELLSISQRDMTLTQYFHKIKSICLEITEQEFHAQLWLVEFENLPANQPRSHNKANEGYHAKEWKRSC